MSYRRTDSAWFIFYHAMSTQYFISQVKDDPMPPSWQGAGGLLEGDYAPQAPAEGTATFTLT